MHFTALPLPSGRFIVAQCNKAGDVTLAGGAPLAHRGPGLNGQLGAYTWRLNSYPATLFYTARDAANCARMLSGLPIDLPRAAQRREELRA